MPRCAPGYALLATLVAASCLQKGGPDLAGKLCTPSHPECPSCLTAIDAGPLLADAGVCARIDAACAGVLCPPDAGVCSGGRCYSGICPDLAGALCLTGLGRCARTGVFACLDGGACIAPDGSSSARSECWLPGPNGALCPCDGVDDDCDGVADNVPLERTFELAPAAGNPLNACAAGDGGVILTSGAQTLIGGLEVAGCAVYDPGARYAIASVLLQASLTGQVCGASAQGAGNAAMVFLGLEADGGMSPLGHFVVTAGPPTIQAEPVAGSYRAYQLCVQAGDAGAPSAVQVGNGQLARSPGCDPL